MSDIPTQPIDTVTAMQHVYRMKMTTLIALLMIAMISVPSFAQPALKCWGCFEPTINPFSGLTNVPSRLELKRQETVKRIVAQLTLERVKHVVSCWGRHHTCDVSPSGILTVDQIKAETMDEQNFSKDDLDGLAQFLITSLAPLAASL